MKFHLISNKIFYIIDQILKQLKCSFSMILFKNIFIQI